MTDQRTSRPVLRVGLSVLTVAALAGTAGCATIPGSSTPEVISSYAASPSLDNVPTPQPGQAPDLLLRSFFSASAHPLNNHQAAREFLSPEEADQWQDATGTLILDRIDLNAEGAASDNRMTYTVRGTVIGTLGTGGAFQASYRSYEDTIDLVLVDGEWRIDSLPSGVIMDRSDFTSTYQPRDVYFLDPTWQFLVPDRRWTYSRQENVGTSLISLLAAGPRDTLTNGVESAFPEGVVAQARTGTDGEFTVDLSGLSAVSSEDMEALAAQIIWTLADSDVRGPYHILADGVPIATADAGQLDTWSVDDAQDFNPHTVPDQPLRALRDGALVEVDDTAQTLPGWTGSGELESAAYAADGTVAAVSGQGDDERRMLVGDIGGTAVTVHTADQLSRPSWTADSQNLYAVADGTQVLRWVRAATGGMTETTVDFRTLDVLDLDDPTISEFTVSRDGTRAAMIINGRLYVSVLENTAGLQSSDGGEDSAGPRLGTPVAVAPNLGDTAVSVGWRPDGALLVGTRANDTPVWVVSVDGSEQTQLTSRNVTAPVVAVASTDSNDYILDGRALLQIDSAATGSGTTDTSDNFWREVPALQGARAVPVTVR
ncbi:LpqB family beta-propeller domain-containing protein [Corynebacterium terpenotabidum]|uniref:Lipoprotein LpqB n=1 Tax=Corynebacterium terpenotabidum Y-11 TaxID=1200352 RepID=S4XFP8_9CORY|nr:LpqB family beta-propeller domain-containing protein [Corynebacterium terpenotabidum]AGP31386.1 lipoprotein LpqB [Corynebacterium terpenotabidum Y-11]